jgi:hypothetical protein
MIAVAKLRLKDTCYICGTVKEYKDRCDTLDNLLRISFSEVLWVSWSNLDPVDTSSWLWLADDIVFIDKFTMDAVEKAVSIMEV